MRRIVSIALALAMAVGLPGFATAQAAVDSVSGTVPSAYRTGANPAVSVSLVNSLTGSVVATIGIGADGSFTFTSVPPGSYVVRVADVSGSLLTTSLTSTLAASTSEIVRWGAEHAGAALVPTAGGGGLSTTWIVVGAAATVGLGVGIYYATNGSKPVSPSR